ncbi:hypothetical protein LJC11_03020, partial [Bacteroidales bacterium OttesenSCG-928-I21]|nr:hypothetical protein [Bacteroidales bacterium OttesenSCG-928-I21]
EQTMDRQLTRGSSSTAQFKTSLTETKGGYLLDFVATEGGGNISEMSERGKAFYEEMKEGIDNTDITAYIGVVSGSSKVDLETIIHSE